jgi:hypothetical protein
MAYIINRFDGTQLTIVDDGVLDISTPLGLIGRNYTGYGETQNENFVFLLENFANTAPPSRALRGQIWYNTTERALKTYNGTDWLSIGNATVAETEPAHSNGGLWLNSVTNQMYVSDGTVWRLVGPEGVEGFTVTKMTSTKIRDSIGTFKPVILSQINGETTAILTNESFTINSSDSILGFSQLYKGINLKSDSFLTGNVKGNADSATRLETDRTINDVAFNGTSNIVVTATTNQPLKPGDYILGSDFSGAFEDTWDINATPENQVGKIVARDSTGSFSASTIIAGEFVGTLLGNVTTLSGTSTFNNIEVASIVGDTFSGLSARATRLSARRTINTVAFDGTEDIILPVPAETLTGSELAPNVVNSSLTTLGQLEYLNVEAPGITIGDGNNINIKIEGFTPTIESDTTNILKLKLATGSVSASPTTLTFLSASAAAADGIFSPAFAPDYTLGTVETNRPVLGLPSHRWKNIYSKEATLDILNVTTLKGRTLSDQVVVSKDLIINGTMYGPVVGNVSGTLTGSVVGAASLNVLKTGDTMSGDLAWTTSGRGLSWSLNTDSASIRYYNSTDNSTDNRLEFNTSDNLDEYFRWTHTSAGSTFESMRLTPNSNGLANLRVLGQITVVGGGVSAVSFVGDGNQITNLNATQLLTGTIPAARLSGTYNINIAGNVAGNVTGNLQGSVTGNVTGNVTGAASLNVLKSGDTMTGDLSIVKDNAWLALDSPSIGTDGQFQAAGISLGESGYKGSATLHFTYTGDGYGHIGMGSVNPSTSLPQYEAIRLYYLDNTVRVLGNMTVAGTASGTFSGTGTDLNINAEKLVIGTLPRGRLSGVYDISISGNANYATSAGSASTASTATTASTAIFSNTAVVTDSRATVTTPQTINQGVVFDFKQNITDGLSDGGTYFGEMTFRPYGSSTDWTGGPSHQLGFTTNGNLWHRSGSNTSWGSWQQFLDSVNYTSYTVTKTGTGASGTWPISISGQSTTVASVTSGQVTSALGYTPVNPLSLSNQSGSAGNFSTGSFSGDVTITKSQPTLFFNDTGDSGIELAIRVNAAEGLIIYEPEDANSEWFRIDDNSGTGYLWESQILTAANYNSFAPSRTGSGASGTWPISISGQSSTVASISSSQVTSALGYTPVNPSALTNQTGAAISGSTGTFTSNISAGNTSKGSNTVITAMAGDSYRAGFEAYGSNQGTGYVYVGQSTDYGGGFSYNGDNAPGFIPGEGSDYLSFFRRNAGTDTVVFDYYYSNSTVRFKGDISVAGMIYGNLTGNVTGNASTVSSISSGQVVAALGYTPANGSGAGLINGEQNYQDYNLKRATIIDYSLAHNALGSVSGGTTVNLELGNYASATAVGAITWTFANPPTGARTGSLILELTNGGAYTQYWPAAVRWPAGTAPSLAAAGVDVLVFITDDAGTNWRGAISMGDSR